MPEADIYLGIFGTTKKAPRVIPFKAHDSMVFWKAIITADTSAMRELIQDGETTVLVEAGNPKVITDIIHQLQSNGDSPEIAKRAQEAYRQKCLHSNVCKEFVATFRERFNLNHILASEKTTRRSIH